MQLSCMKSLKKKFSCFKKEKFNSLLLIGLITISGLMWGFKFFQPQIISTNKSDSDKNYDLIDNLLPNDLEDKYFKIKPTNSRSYLNYQHLKIKELETYNESLPIVIDGDSDFINQANLFNWTGDGNFSTPYIIANLNITANDVNVNLIEIRDTNLSFQISDCLLQSGRYGIYLNNASYGSVSNSIIRNNTRYGIEVNYGQLYTLSKLVLEDNYWGGVIIGSSNNTSLLDINSTNNGNGISIHNSINNSLSNINTDSNNGQGISVSYSENSNFSSILSRNNNQNGFHIYNSIYSSFLNTNCINNSEVGLLISSSLNCEIAQSSFSNNSRDGLTLEYSNETSIRFCDFYNNSNDGIDLTYSNHFALLNLSILNNSYEGLKADTALNGSFNNIACSYNNGEGFGVGNSENLLVSNCIIVNNSNSGINIDRSQDISVIENIITNNSFGLYSWKGGFYIQDSNNCTISNNYIFRNKGDGIELINTNKTVISFNAIYKHDDNGISISTTSMRNLVSNNIVYNNTYYGFYGYFSSSKFITDITDADKNIIMKNDFIANQNWESQGYVQGSNFDVHHNYWDNLQPLDEDEDGIVDNAYLLGWSSDQNERIFDDYPLVEPTNTPTIHYLTTPILLYPRSRSPPEFPDEGFDQGLQEISYNGTIRIQWVDPIDSENHRVYISIYYSCSYGENWTELISGIETSYYDWDTTTFADGYLQLRIIATCTHGESTMDTDDEMIQIDNRPPVFTDLRASHFSPIFYIVLGLIILPIFKRSKKSN